MMRQVERNMEKPHCFYFVAKESEQVVAAAFVRLRSGGRSAHLARAYTVPSYRRKGVMRRLEQFIVTFLKRRGFTTLDLTVVPSNKEGMAAWPALGYKPTKIVMTKEIVD
jgi:GNAT superfamily N-acetyltransferase